MHVLRQRLQHLRHCLSLIRPVMADPVSRQQWLLGGRRLIISLCVVATLLTLVPWGTGALTDAIYQPVVKEKKLFGVIRTSKEVDNPLRERRQTQLLVLCWLLGGGALLVLWLEGLPAAHAAARPDQDAGATGLRPQISAVAEIAAGQRAGVDGRYRIEGHVAKGGMGEIYLATDTTLNRRVALKALAAEQSHDGDQRERFRQEALALAQLSHPHITAVMDLFEDAGRFWFAMEWLSGGDLEQRLQAGPMAEAEAAGIIADIAAGLAAAHAKGFVHRDIKPANILFTDTGLAKLTDFGVAKNDSSAIVTQIGMTLGSPGYMSPEQAAGGAVDARSDIYSLGVTLFRLVTGALPFQGDTTAIMSQHITQPPPVPSAVNADLSDDISQIILRCMAKAPEQRYQDAAELEQVLRRLA